MNKLNNTSTTICYDVFLNLIEYVDDCTFLKLSLIDKNVHKILNKYLKDVKSFYDEFVKIRSFFSFKSTFDESDDKEFYLNNQIIYGKADFYPPRVELSYKDKNLKIEHINVKEYDFKITPVLGLLDSTCDSSDNSHLGALALQAYATASAIRLFQYKIRKIDITFFNDGNADKRQKIKRAISITEHFFDTVDEMRQSSCTII